ncbi:MAG: hypothetical protein JNJ69_14030 [Leptospiraceae bacterium]|nr:hypothetical protein [Leptospiraceae bacterium]
MITFRYFYQVLPCFFMACGSFAQYTVRPIVENNGDQILELRVTNKWRRDKLPLNFIEIYAILIPAEKFEKKMQSFGGDVDLLRIYLDEMIYVYHSKRKYSEIMLVKEMHSNLTRTATGVIYLNKHNNGFRNSIGNSTSPLSPGYYLWRSRSSAIWSIGIDRQEILFRVLPDRIDIIYKDEEGFI